MSTSNHTPTIELSQYVSTDKTSYLVNYNDDMLKIDSAIATDRDNINTATEKANTADGKADTNKLSIDNINATLNGDPEVPSDTGLIGDVSGLESSVNTINSLIGDGHPTTSNQTIIGAINGLESALAPREDDAALGANYAIGEQFARGGLLYTALVSLTAGTAFTALVLNTDYKVSDSIVEQIAGASPTPASTTELQRGTLTAGQTSVALTFAEQTIGATTLIDVYVEDALNFNAIATTSTTVTLTFEAQAANKAVAIRVIN